MYVLHRTIARVRFNAPIGGWINAIKIAEDVAAALPMMRPVWRFANNLINPFAPSVAPQARSLPRTLIRVEGSASTSLRYAQHERTKGKGIGL
jgi:hypothetical protein